MRGAFLTLLFFSSFLGMAQERCATNQLASNLYRTESSTSFENWLKKEKNQPFRSSNSVQRQSIYKIPVVFHIIHTGTAIGREGNLSDVKILEQLDILNADFRRTNTDASVTPESFLAVAADTEIEFVMALRDPEGLPTSGIVRLRGSRDVYDPINDDILLKSESFWDQDYYLNIYVTDLSSGNLGAAQFPFSSIAGSELKNYKSTDGLMLDYKWVGLNENTGSFDSYGRTATHEIGHYLGLKHIWGDGGCGFDDFCDDTPEAQNSTTGCPLAKATCGTPDMIQNYMDYTHDVCMNLFTQCQKERMRLVLESSPRRASLLTSSGLLEPVMVANDMGIRSIISPTQAACEIDQTASVELRNYGTNAVSNFEVAFYVNGDLIDSKQVNANLTPSEKTVISFESVMLNASMGDVIGFEIIKVNGTDDQNRKNNIKSITITPVESEVAPYFIDFSSGLTLSNYMENGATSYWQTGIATNETTDNKAAFLPFYDQEANFGYRDILVTNTLDLSALTSAQLEFDYAYAAGSAQEKDGLIVIVSTDCGSSFKKQNIIFERYGLSLATRGASASYFIPTGPTDWDNINLNITQYAGMDQVKIGFMGVNAGGNNIYLDDIRVTSANLLSNDAGIKSVEDLPVVSCEAYARPIVDIKNFGFESIKSINLSVKVNNLEEVFELSDLNITSGKTQSLPLNISKNIINGFNEIQINITGINGGEDQFLGNNFYEFQSQVIDIQEPMPIREDFENNIWTIANPNQTLLFENINLSGNQVLRSNSFNNDTIASSYLVSPIILTGNYRKGAIRFDYSYGQRLGYNDNLKVLLSVNCGKTFDIELLSLNADQLATALSSGAWVPDELDWKTFFLDITEHMTWPELRIAFVISNGNGNHLYIDNIDVLTTNDPDQPAFDIPVQLYPNPAFRTFNLALNLERKQTIQVRIMDMSGHIIFDRPYPNSINQTLEFEAPSQSGFYLIQVTGENNLNQIKRLFIRR
ncbi:MAG: hypothetical protein ACI83W_001430 [Marinoscillum sp.]|jgi:hypothetical protein